MSKKRKILLFSTIGIIVVCYGITFIAILNHSDEPMTKNIKKIENTNNREFNKIANEVEESLYIGNQLQNGSSPFDDCFGKGIYSGNAILKIKNGASSDAIVCLYSISKSKTIRNEYVQKNTSFTMDNISQGSYKIKVFYGNNWNPELENPCGTIGFFESDVKWINYLTIMKTILEIE